MKRMFRVAAALALLAPQMASAAAIVTNQWYTFTFGGVGSALASGAAATLGVNPASISAPDGPWTFTLTGDGSLSVVDGFLSGDQFSISDFGAGIGTTSTPVGGGDCSNDITACLANSSISQGSFALSAGAHSISGTTLLSPFGGGAAFFRVNESAVPEPSTWMLMLLGFGMIGFGMRSARRRQNLTVSYS